MLCFDDSLTIVMYHYVRDLGASDFPALKGLDVAAFEAQLRHLQSHYFPVSTAEVLAALDGEAPLPPHACWLTFDDGFRDHYEVVFPRLQAAGISGAFFPAAQPVFSPVVLDVHKIHFILAAEGPPLLPRLQALLLEACEVFNTTLPPWEALIQGIATASRFDPPEVVLLKRLLQSHLPEAIRAWVTQRLFLERVTDDEAGFAASLYMTLPELQTLARQGMTIGAHGGRHRWLAELDEADQAGEIDAGLALLAQVYGETPQEWAMCYPYGSYNSTTLKLLQARGAGLAVTTAVATARLHPHMGEERYQLPRLDTNDLPSRPTV